MPTTIMPRGIGRNRNTLGPMLWLGVWVFGLGAPALHPASAAASGDQAVSCCCAPCDPNNCPCCFPTPAAPVLPDLAVTKPHESSRIRSALPTVPPCRCVTRVPYPEPARVTARTVVFPQGRVSLVGFHAAWELGIPQSVPESSDLLVSVNVAFPQYDVILGTARRRF